MKKRALFLLLVATISIITALLILKNNSLKSSQDQALHISVINNKDSIIKAYSNYIDSLSENYYIVNKKDFKLIRTLNLKVK